MIVTLCGRPCIFCSTRVLMAMSMSVDIHLY